MVAVTELDVSELEPPEPLTRILAAAQALADKTVLRIYHRRDPLPLYPLLDELGLHHQTRQRPDGAVTLLVWHASHDLAPSRCQELLADAH